MTLRNTAGCFAAICVISLVGCASSRGRTSGGYQSPQQTAARTPQAPPQLDNEQLLHIGDTLRMQGKSDKAAEVYGWILQRDPNNVAARQRLHASPARVAIRQRLPEESLPGVQPFPEWRRPDVPRRRTRRRPAVPEVLPAPPADEGAASPQSHPFGEPSKSTATDLQPRRQYLSRSELQTTVVSDPQRVAANDDRGIQIIPATKSGCRPVQDAHKPPAFPEDSSAGPPIISRGHEAPIRRTSVEVAPSKSVVGPERGRFAAPKPTGVPAGLVVLAECVKTPERHLATISGYLNDESPQVRSLAAFLLGRSGAPAQDHLTALEIMLKTEQDDLTRIRAAEAVLRLSPNHLPARQVLLAGLSSSNRAVRWEAVCVADVMKDHPQRAEVLTKVHDRLQDVEDLIRIMAALKLGEFQSDKGIALSALESLLREPNLPAKLREAAVSSRRVLQKDQSTPQPFLPAK